MFEAFAESERWARARSDTKGFEAWSRNALTSLIPAAIQFIVTRRQAGNDALSDFLWALATFIVAFVCLPLLELGWNYFRAPRRLLTDENARLRVELTEYQERLEARQSPGQYKDIRIARHVLTIVNRSADKSAPEFYAIVQVELTNGNDFAVDLTPELSIQMGFTRLAAPAESWPMEDLIPELTAHHAAAIGPQLKGLVSVDANRTRAGCLVFLLNPFILAGIQAKAKLDGKELDVLTLRVQDRNRPIEGRASIILHRQNIIPFLPDEVPPFIRFVKKRKPAGESASAPVNADANATDAQAD